MRWVILFFCLGQAAWAEPPDRQCNTGTWGRSWCVRDAYVAFDTCHALQDAARLHRLDLGFFTRLIWQESRFDAFALSPVGAQGIAQFMPQTAKLRGLGDAFNPAEALDHSAQYLAELVSRFGNIGMAAVAYNGGETRATNFRAKTGGLARETIDYVQIITGLSAKEWRDATPSSIDLKLKKKKSFIPACLALAKSRLLPKPTSLRPRLRPKRVKPWGMQMATGSTRAKVKASYGRNSRPCRNVIGKRKPDYIKKSPQVTGRQIYYVARLGFETRGKAQRMCNRIRKFDCVCAVYKN